MGRIGFGVILALGLIVAPLLAEAQGAATSGTLTFENADIQTLIKHVGSLTGITFLFEPEMIKGKITLLSPKSVPPEEALELLKSALALLGYRLVSRTEGMWIVPAVRVTHEAMTVKVIPLTYARAGELAFTLSRVAPPWIRIVPHYPTNSLIISGPPPAVDELIDIIQPSVRD